MDVTIRLFSDAAGQLRRVSFDYDTGAWPDPDDRARFAQAYMRLLEAAATNLDLRIGDVDVLRAGDAAGLTLRTPSLGADTPAVSSILAQADLRPDAPAVACGDVALTYAELAARIHSFARGLSEKGVGTGDLVAIGMERSTDLVIALLGTMQAGAAYIPIDPHQPESRIAMIGEDAHCALSVVDELSGSLAKALPRTCSFIDILTAGQAATSEPAGPSALAYVIFTSGSTGRPKGVRVRQRGLSAFLAAMAQRPGLTETDRVLAVTTVSFDIAALELFGPLVVGGAVRLATVEDALDGARLAALMAQDGTTVFQATPATYKLLLTADWQAPNVKALCGGEALPRDLAEAILPCCGALWNMYGPTETTIWSSVERVVAGRPVRLGDPIAGTSLSVRTDTLALAPRGTPGELVIGGEGLAEGYHERPDLTAVQFPEDPLDFSQRLYRTGDGARVAADGRIEFLGRLDFQVKVRGYRIELGEVEAAVRAAVGISDAVVATFSDASDQTALVAHVVPDGPFDEARTRAAVATALPAYMRPSAYVMLDALPLTPNGKVDRKALKAPTPTRTTSIAVLDAVFADDLQRSLASIFSKLLGRSDVGPDAHFFEMGGHSLLALSLVEDVEKATGAKLSLGTVFTVPILADLAVWIREGGQASGQAATAVVPLQPDGDGVPIFCLCGIELYRPVALAMGRTNPVFGLYVEEEGALLRQAVEGEVGNVSIGELAVAYANAIERNAGLGPIHLMGASFGGVMALEVADLLARKGCEIVSVVMLDTIRPDEIRRDWLRIFSRRLRTLVLRPDLIVARLRARLGAGPKGLARKGDGVLTAADKDGPNFARLRELAYIEAMRGYQPDRRVPIGQVILVRATDHSIFGHGMRLSADYGWSQALGRNVDVVDVDGSHLAILRDDRAETTGRVLAERLCKTYIVTMKRSS
jgi:amino acid adenylation domain-containing protein